MVRAVAADMAPAAAAIALRARAFALAFTVGYLIRLSSATRVGRPEVAVVTPPVSIFVEFTFNVSIWILIFSTSVNAADLLVCVIGICVQSLAARPILAFAV